MEKDKFTTALERYRIDSDHVCDFCCIGRGLFEEGVHTIGRLCPSHLVGEIWKHYRLLKDLGRNACKHGLQKLCKISSGYVKMGGPRISSAWRYIVYWELFFGYVAYKKPEAIYGDMQQWLVNFLRLGGPLGEDEYLELLAQEVATFMETEWHMPYEYMKPLDWCKSGKWMEGKAGTGKKITVEIGTKRVRSRRMKPLEGVFHSDKAVMEELKRPCLEEMFVIQKSEGGKIRGVVKTGNCLNRKMNYLSEVVERGLYGSELSTLFAGEEGNEKIDLDMLSAVRDNSDWCVPLDQGAFDYHQSKKSILVVLAQVLRHVLRMVGDPEVTAVGAALWDSLNVEGARVYGAANETLWWKNGLPSGWRWTAVMDTLLNIGSFRVVQRLVGRARGKYPTIRHFYAQGDDVVYTCPDLQDIQMTITIYGALGYEVHPQKTYISRNRAEFLRRSYEPWGITGYAARTVGGLRFRNPIQEIPLAKGERLYARLVQWHLTTIRGARTDAVADMLMEDCQQMGLSPYHCAAYFLTPSAVGGGGLDPASKLGRALYGKYKPREWKTIIVDKELRPVHFNLGMWNRRLKDADVELRGSSKYIAYDNLIASWGIREADRVRRTHFRFQDVDQSMGLRPSVRGNLPTEEDMWDLKTVPIQVRGIVKRDAVARGWEEKWLKPGWVAWARMLAKRVSNRVYQGIMNQDFSIPCVLTDNVGLRYGGGIKKEIRTFLDGVLTSKNCSLKKVERTCLWIEHVLRAEFRRLGSQVVLAQ